MSTTYILHGGETLQESLLNDAFYTYFTSLVNKDHVKILMCLWARYPEKRAKVLEKHKQKIIKNSRDKTFELLVASDPKDLLNRMDEYDILYIDGGEGENIEPFYSELTELKNKLCGKVCIGSSMGAYVISEHYVLSNEDQDTNHVHNGLGLLPINCLCHWNIEDKKQEKITLIKKNSNLPIIALNECESVVIIT
jgi:peptidase E